jgi:peptidoglycan hydrolase-like protein with peptidoglycan-binding domain
MHLRRRHSDARAVGCAFPPGRRSRRTSAELLAVLAVLGISACSGGSGGETSTTSSSSTSSTTTSLTSTTTDVTTSSTTSTTGPTTTLEPVLCVGLLQEGCEGAPVERLQRLLRAGVETNLAVDGEFGPKTESALLAFETFLCAATICDADGIIIVDGPEWDVLADLTPIPTTTFEPSR